MRLNLLKKSCVLFLAISLLTGCAPKSEVEVLEYTVKPETFELQVVKGDTTVSVSKAAETREVENFLQEEAETSWHYPEEKIDVSIKAEKDYLQVTLTSKGEEDNEFVWPEIAGDTYYMPLGEGKRIPAGDSAWKKYLEGQEFEMLEQFSMPFWSTAEGDSAVTFISENPFRNTVNFQGNELISFSLRNEYPKIDSNKTTSFRVYVTGNEPSEAAKIYRNYVIEKGGFVTLEEKAEANPNIKKLYGAPHIYLEGDESTDLVKDIKAAGIEKAWIGLHSWERADAEPELVKTAADLGYLIAPYDSYHSIHKPGEEQWITAAFADETLYENAVISKRNGEKVSGFQKVGRKLNPTLSLPAVKERVERLLDSHNRFNSWFIDCDATGEIYDDYSPEHMTTKEQDLDARLKRMVYIRDEKNMVIGSEGGHDFAASTIAFAHGIELGSFSWMDDDMKRNKESEYYMGRYYSPTGGITENFSKRVPIKKDLYTVFVDPKYDLPLFKLVYNDSVITSYHWDWSTFKIKGAVADRMLREVLYNVPPLYHLDKTEWGIYEKDILSHTKVWSKWSEQVINREMTDFKNLTEDGSVQMCMYGDAISVISNFGDSAYEHEGKEIPAHALVMRVNGEDKIYQPQVENK